MSATPPPGAIAAASAAHDHANCVHSAALDAVRAGRPDVRRRLAWALLITVVFMFAEVVGGLLANSLALLADAGHMLTDAGALGLALGVAWWNARTSAHLSNSDAALSQVAGVANRRAVSAMNGAAQAQRREAWAAVVNGTILLLVVAAIFTEAVGRLRAPEPVETGLMLVVAVLGLAVNVAAALLLRPVVSDNLNARGAYVHVLGDLLGSVGTIVAALVIRETGYLIADPVASLVVSVLVLRAAALLLRDSVRVLRAA